MSRKAFTVAVVATTIAWSIGLSALLAPLSASAVTGGTLVKASLPAVYYVGSDMKRYVFPNEKTFKTWYADFSSVQTITDAELAALAIGGNVTYKPGIRMVKITTDPKVYAVDAHGALRWVSSEAVAVALYGASWNLMIDDVPDAFFTNYTIGADITAASQFVPATVSGAASSINADKNLGGVVAGGALSVMLSSSQPMGGTLPLSANGVTVLKADVRNGSSSAVTLDSMTVKRLGPGTKDDFDNVYAYEGNNRLSSGRTISTTNDVTFGGLNVALAAGETKTLLVVVDVSGGALAGDVNSFQITALTAGSVAASGLPVSGPSFTLAGVEVGEIVIDAGGTLSNVKAGQLGGKVASFKLEAGNQEDVLVNKIVLYYAGGLDRTKLANLVLKQAGNTLASVSALNSKDQAVFVLATPFSLEKGSTRNFEVYADVAASAKAGDTIEFYLEEAADLLAIGQTYGYGVMVDMDLYDGEAGDLSETEVEAGKLTITFNGPAAKDVGANSKDVELFNFTMAAASNLEVKETRIELTEQDMADDELTDVKIVDTASGVVVAGPMDAGDDTVIGGQLHYKASFYISAGQARTFKVTADIGKDADEGDEVQLSLLSFAGRVKNLDNNTTLDAADMVPSTKLTGNTHTVKKPSLDVSGSSSPVAQTYIMGAQGAALMGIGLQAGDAGEVKVNSLSFQGWVDDVMGCVGDADDDPKVSSLVQTASLWDGSTQVGSTESPTTGTECDDVNPLNHGGGVLVFDNLNLTIAKGATKNLVLKGNIPTGIQDMLNADLFFSIEGADDVDAVDADGDTVDAEGTFAVEGPEHEIMEAGDLSVALAPSDTESDAGLLVGGTSNAVLGKFKWTAEFEELKITKAKVDVTAPRGVTSLSLYDGSTLVAGPSSVNGTTGEASFTNVNFVVPKDGSKVLTVKGNLAAVSSSGATIGDNVQVTVLADGFEARGTSAGSSTLLDGGDVNGTGLDLGANEKRLVKSKPTVSLVALPTSVLSAGDQVVLRFTVAADAAGDIALRRIVANVAKSGTVTLAKASGGDDSTMKRVGGDYLPATVTWGSPTLTILLDGDETIAAGTSKTFDVYMNMSGAVSSDSVSSYLKDDAAWAVGNLPAGNFIWSDLSALNHVTNDYATGWKVKTLPTDSQTLTK